MSTVRDRLGALGPVVTVWLPAVVAVIVPLAGVLLTGVAYADKRMEDARRIGAGTVLGFVLWTIILTS